MSFQGDVAGIGLGELLQGLARGGKDGVLTLYGDNLASTLGLEGGLLFLLESPEETEDEWRRRADCAWANAPDSELDLARRTAIARAERMETVFRMLEAANLHFRFEPGPLPMPRNARLRRSAVYALDGHTDNGNPWGVGMGVEAVLLEHARISDETGPNCTPQRYDIPVPVPGVEPPTELHGFYAQCDGQSTLGEIADRLASPARQCQGTVSELLNRGVIRLAEARELLGGARAELEQSRLERASSRLEGWLRKSPPGPPHAEDVDQLIALWESGRITAVLELLPGAMPRQIVRKLDIIDPDLANRLDRWEDLARAQPNNVITRFHCALLRSNAIVNDVAIEGDGHELVMECLRLARTFAEKDGVARARAILRVAATTQPTAHQVRVELGARMIEHGMRAEGAAWMLEAAKALMADEDHDRAGQVLGLLLKGVPEHHDAQVLLAQTQQTLAKAKKRRRHGLVLLSTALAISMVAFVQFHAKQERDKNFRTITDVMSNPTEALRLLDEHFENDGSDRVVALRSALEQRQSEMDKANRDAWNSRYDAIVQAIESGDPAAVYERVVGLSRPPIMQSGLVVRWGQKDALLAGLLKRLEGDFESVPEGIEATDEQLRLESEVISACLKIADGAGAETGNEFERFAEDLRGLHERATTRRAARDILLDQDVVQRKQEQLDRLLASARYFRESGQLEEAVATYDEFLAEDDSGEVSELFDREIDLAREQLEGYRAALAEAQAGRHDDARDSLEATALDPARIQLPWRIDTVPSGALVQLGDGTTYTTPFVLETTSGELVTLDFTLENCEPQTLEVDRPGDVVLSMHRSPERSWTSPHRIEAAPIAVGSDHIVTDRGGRLARISPQGDVRWEATIDSLGGVARTPQFLAARPGYLLLLTEDGDAWLLAAEDGALEGPVSIGAPVYDGPRESRGNLMATFDNGTYAIWESDLEPSIYPAVSRDLLEIERDSPYDDGSPSVRVLRAGRGLPPELASDWTDWRVEIEEDHYLVRRNGEQSEQFTVRREGKWAFLAWEQPNVFMPSGRLWVSDEAGLRGFLPEEPDQVAEPIENHDGQAEGGPAAGAPDEQ